MIPIAYYAIALRQEPDQTFAAFWWKTVTVGPWPSGPLWFVWVLLVFDLLASLLYRLSPNLLDPIHRLSEQCFDQPAKFFLFLLAVTAMVYIPALIYFGPNRWFEFGPFSVQASRILLYAAYFFIGAGIGVAHLNRGSAERRRTAGEEQLGLVDRDPHSLLPDVGADLHQARNIGQSRSAAHMVSRKLRFLLRRLQRGHPVRHPGLFPGLEALTGPYSIRMQADAYGIFLVHYPIVLWLQYWLFDYDLPAIVKATIAFVLTVALSWAVTAALRKIPGATTCCKRLASKLHISAQGGVSKANSGRTPRWDYRLF